MKPNAPNNAHNVSSAANADILEGLRSQLRSLESGQKTIDRNADRISSGCDALDQMLPAGGFLPGQLVEWLAEGAGHGGSTLALMVARAAIQPHKREPAKTLVVVDRTPKPSEWTQQQTNHLAFNGCATFYPPAAAELGINLQQLVILRPNTAADEIWAIDQALRCPCVGAVWAWMPKLNDRDFRRFQLAAEAGGTLGLLIRPAHTRGEPTWADIQFLVETRPSYRSQSRESSCGVVSRPLHSLDRRSPRPAIQSSPTSQSPPAPAASTSPISTPPRRRRWQITLLRCRGGTAGKQLLLELDETSGTLSEFKPSTKSATTTGASHEKSPLPLAAQLANPASRRGTQFTTPPPSTRNRNSA